MKTQKKIMAIAERWMKPYRCKKEWTQGLELRDKFGPKKKWPRHIMVRGMVFQVKRGMPQDAFLPDDWMTAWNPFGDHLAALELMSATGISVSRPKRDSDWIAELGKQTCSAETFSGAVAGLAWKLLRADGKSR